MFIFLPNRIIFDVIFVLLIILSRRNRNGVTSSFRKFAHSHRYSTREFLRLRDSGHSGGVYLRLLAAGVPTSLAIFAFVRDRGNNLKRRRRTYASFKWSEKWGAIWKQKERERVYVWGILNNNGCVRRLDSKEGKLKGEK